MNKTIIVSAPAFGDTMGELMGLPSWDEKLDELQRIYETHGIKSDTVAHNAFRALAEGRRVFTESQELIDLIKEVLGGTYSVFTVESEIKVDTLNVSMLRCM